MIHLRPYHIRRLIEADLGITINTKSRRRDLVEARHIYCKIAKKHTSFSLQKIGREIKRDHTSVLHSIKRADEFLSVDVDFSNKYHNLEDKFFELSANNFARFLTKEDKLQNAVMQYFKLKHPKAFVIHCPNEGKRTPFERYKFKYLGGFSGVPDILCFDNRGGYSGLAIELKVGYNKPTDNQKACLEKLEDKNWLATWVNNFDDAAEIIDNYFDFKIDLNV